MEKTLTSPLTQSVKGAVSSANFIPMWWFLLFIGADLLIVAGSFLGWYLVWVPANRLTLTGPRQDSVTLHKGVSLARAWTIFQSAIKDDFISSLPHLYKKCGFQAYAFLYWERKLALTMAVLCITDLCLWIPYQLCFEGWTSFSLVSMLSTNNDTFRTFYTIWIASLMLYSLSSMYNYLKFMLVHLLYRQPRIPLHHSQKHPFANYSEPTNADYEYFLLNNLKAKTLYVSLIGVQKLYNEAQIKTQVQSYLVEEMGQEDRVLAVMPIPDYAPCLKINYKLEILEVVRSIGAENFSKFWKFFKYEDIQAIAEHEKANREQITRYLRNLESQKPPYESCFVVVSKMETAERLCHEFGIGKALLKLFPELDQDYYEEKGDRRMIVKWAQEPNDVMWVNLKVHRQQLFNFIIFNALCIAFLFFSFFMIALTSSNTLKLPSVIGPLFLALINSLLRWLISKMVELEKLSSRSDEQIKEFKYLAIYFLINVILGSLVRDTLNMLDVLKTGWGFIELLKLIYQKIDGYFYYLFILNQTAFTFMDTLLKPADIFLDCFEVQLYYDKTTTLKQRSLYAINDSFRFGYSYAIDFIVLALILIYSVSSPLIHFFGMLFFVSRFYLNTYTFLVFHKEEAFSHLRMVGKAIEFSVVMVALWIFLTATSLIFDLRYSNALILYIYCGITIGYAATWNKIETVNDIRLETDLHSVDLRKVLEKWNQSYRHPFEELKSNFI